MIRRYIIWTRNLLITPVLVALIAPCALDAQFYRYMDIRPVSASNVFDSPGGYFVVFAARRGVPGHTFVMFAHQDWNRKLTSIEAFGHYPDIQAPGVFRAAFGPVPGALREEIAAKRDTGCCDWSSPDILASFKVDRDVFDRAKDVQSRWARNVRTYELVDQDCVTFLMEVGAGMGLDMPPRGPTNATPSAYMESFLRALDRGVYYEQRRGVGDQMWRLSTNAPSTSAPGGNYWFERMHNAQPTGTRREGSYELGESGRRARGTFSLYVHGRLKGTSEIFRDGDQYHQLFPPYSGRPSSTARYYFRENREPSYRDFAPVPDRDNAPAESWGGGQYEGDWRHGLPNGSGRWHGPDGTVYIGAWSDGAPQGRGELRLPDGGRYVGAFRGGQVTGRGVHITRAGERREGQFRDGRLISGTLTTVEGRDSHVGGEGATGRTNTGSHQSDQGETMRVTEIDKHGNVTREGSYEVKGCC